MPAQPSLLCLRLQPTQKERHDCAEQLKVAAHASAASEAPIHFQRHRIKRDSTLPRQEDILIIAAIAPAAAPLRHCALTPRGSPISMRAWRGVSQRQRLPSAQRRSRNALQRYR